jgi:glycoprotein 6-alpha-L-fucosyltransferase
MMKGRKITVGQGLVMALFFLVFLDLLLALNYHAKKLVTNEEEQFEEDASIIDVEGTMPTTKAMIIIKDNANNHGREEQYLNNTKVLELMKHKFKIEKGVRSLWYDMRDRLVAMRTANAFDDMDGLVSSLSQWQKSILVQVQNLQELDADWESNTTKEMSELLQNKLHQLQNPSDCASARKIFCSSDNGNPCGFGCLTHHLLHCFIVAYWTNRTLVVDTKGWNYSWTSEEGKKGWEAAFLPVSDTCTTAEGAVEWSQDHKNHQVVSLPERNRMDPKPSFLTQPIPREFADKLFTFHEDPFAWFAGHLLSYLMRPNEELKTYISTKKKSMGITKPYVGIHVRRTDKLISEAKNHSLDEYMVHVEHWYQLYGNVDKKRVFIATDDPGVFKEAREKYTGYEIYGDENAMQSAQLKSRYSLNSLLGIIYDVFVLAESDFVVCTFSSNVSDVQLFLESNAQHQS